MAGVVDSLSGAERDALRRRESHEASDPGFEELARRRVEGLPLVRRGERASGEPEWFVTIFGLGLAFELDLREGTDRTRLAALDDAA